jgi:hypothetical protein
MEFVDTEAGASSHASLICLPFAVQNIQLSCVMQRRLVMVGKPWMFYNGAGFAALKRGIVLYGGCLFEKAAPGPQPAAAARFALLSSERYQ